MSFVERLDRESLVIDQVPKTAYSNDQQITAGRSRPICVLARQDA